MQQVHACSLGVVEWNSGKYRRQLSKVEVDKVGWGKVDAEKKVHFNSSSLKHSRNDWVAKLTISFFFYSPSCQTCRWLLMQHFIVSPALYSLRGASCAMHFCHIALMEHPINIWCINRGKINTVSWEASTLMSPAVWGPWTFSTSIKTVKIWKLI